MNSVNDNKLEISHVFHVTRERLWKAWTTPEEIARWWGPEGFYAPSIKNNFFVGGMCIYSMHGPEGSSWDRDMYSSGVYKEIDPMRKIVLTEFFSDSNGAKISPSAEGMSVHFPDETTVSVLFEDVDEENALLRLIYDLPKNHDEREALLSSGLVEGWESSFKKLEGALIAAE